MISLLLTLVLGFASNNYDIILVPWYNYNLNYDSLGVVLLAKTCFCGWEMTQGSCDDFFAIMFYFGRNFKLDWHFCQAETPS